VRAAVCNRYRGSPNVILPFNDAALAQRFELNEAALATAYVETQARLGLVSGAIAQPLAGGVAAFAGVTSPISRAIALGMLGRVDDADCDAVEDFYRRRGAVSQVDLCPLADPSLAGLLGARGYHCKQFLNANFRPLSAHEHWPATPGVTVTVVEPSEADLWCATVARGFAAANPVLPDNLDIARPTPSNPLVRCFLARIDDEPVGAGALAIHDGAARLFSTSTVPAFRRRGVHTALLRARLQLAAPTCEIALVSAVPGSDSQRNLERAGFRVAYTRIRMVAPAAG
jgi:ribosomal protein S18 acetylase RimI-like enzyme